MTIQDINRDCDQKRLFLGDYVTGLGSEPSKFWGGILNGGKLKVPVHRRNSKEAGEAAVE